MEFQNSIQRNCFICGFELTTLVVIGIDCIGRCKSNLPYDHDHDGPPSNGKTMKKWRRRRNGWIYEFEYTSIMRKMASTKIRF